MTTQHNATFNELVFAAVSEATRVSNTDLDFQHQFVGSDAPGIPAGPSLADIERSNDIFNLGVHAGAAGLLDNLHKNGYVIHDPEGEKVSPSEGKTFSEDYFSRKYWEQVSS